MKTTHRLIGKLVMALGIAVIAGSVMGGAVLAADLWRADDQADTSVPVGDESTVPPTGTSPPGDPTPMVTTAASSGSNPSRTLTPPATTQAPEPSPTCWAGPGEHPEGIEDCEDD